MSNEAIIRDRLENAIDFTVADSTGIEKGALLALTDPRTAIAPTSAGQVLAGIAAREKVANDTRTRLGFYRRGVFDMVCSGAVTLGAPVIASGDTNFPNTIKGLTTTNASGASVLGHALETGSDAEVIQVYVNIGAGLAHGGA